ncbi:MAG: 4a-hydroxytetrahydrobiopterin dehydratase [Rhodospirillales bacterium]|nr:4a-hydroxytetrahydrobiopterin dehydratase [Rhodospirillales bacterium]MSP80309.1 4a-hydroxytetrahydrobiopterin dehydratase [Rhodospirillales bacterium]
MSKAKKTYPESEVRHRLADEFPGWRFSGGHIERVYRTSGWRSSLLAANAIGHLAEAAWHHPDLLVSFRTVTVRLMTHDSNGITDLDFALARKIEETVGWRPALEGSPLPGTPDNPQYKYLDYDAAPDKK